MNDLTFDYPRLWKTLMRTGIKERFSQVRREFFMKIATDGAREYYNEDDRTSIIEDSELFAIAPGLMDYLDKAIPIGARFKHHNYVTQDGDLVIEYFANLSTGIPTEFVDFITPDGVAPDYSIDGHCTSISISDVDVTKTSDEDEETTITKDITAHLIIIGEGTGRIDAEMYPMIIKHELTHACIFELRKLIHNGYYNNIRIPGTWTDEDINNWTSDVDYLVSVLDGDGEENNNFIEFICDFLMYESDGSIKVKNPIKESKVPKSSRPDAKPKVTYRTMTPFDRFQETIDMMEDGYGKVFTPILESLRECYDDYDTFLDDIRM